MTEPSKEALEIAEGYYTIDEMALAIDALCAERVKAMMKDAIEQARVDGERIGKIAAERDRLKEALEALKEATE